MEVVTHYKKLHGEQEGRVKVDYRDKGITGTLYADSYEQLYRATRFLTLRSLDKSTFLDMLADTHGEEG